MVQPPNSRPPKKRVFIKTPSPKVANLSTEQMEKIEVSKATVGHKTVHLQMENSWRSPPHPVLAHRKVRTFTLQFLTSQRVVAKWKEK